MLHPGANVASWNVEDEPIEERDGELRIGSVPLIYFHFHGHTFPGPRAASTALALSFSMLAANASLRRVCDEYLNAVARNEALLDAQGFGTGDKLGVIRGDTLPRSTQAMMEVLQARVGIS